LEVGEVKRQLYKCLSAIETQEPEHPLVEAITPVGSNTSPILIAFISGLESIGGLDWDDDNNPIPVISDGERENLSSLISNIEARMRLVLPAYTHRFTFRFAKSPWPSREKQIANASAALSLNCR
jgi:hypothetical protein